MLRRTLMTALLLASTAGALLAHELFMKLETYFLVPGTEVTIPILNGTFMTSENSITADRVLDVSVVRQGERAEVGMARWLAGANNRTTYLTIETGPPGTGVIGVSTEPRVLALAGADFNDYLEHDGIPDVLDARRRDGELNVDVRERYGKHIKAVVQVGDARTGDWAARLGYPAEVVPLQNPYDLSVGDEIAVVCLVDGEPVPNQLVFAGGHGADGAMDEASARTDASGHVRFRLGEAGRWYVRFIHMVRTDDADLDYESKWATLSFEIR